jgi:hypothetical protein
MSSSSPVRVLFSATDLAVGHWKNVCLVVWRAKPTLASAQELERQYRHLAKLHPRGFLSVGVIEAGVANPGDAERKAISSAMDAVQNELLGAAAVLEATGFAAAALRAVLATMSLLTRSRFPRRFTASVAEAAMWAAPLAPDLGGADALAAALAEFRATIAQRPAV